MVRKKNKNLHSEEKVIKTANKAEGVFVVINDKGLHTRPSTELVKCTTNFKSHVNLIYQDLIVNGKSLLGILTLAATRGSRIRIEADGEDAFQVVEEVIKLARNKFHIQY
ncbi:MAG: HPr family phosphocarrier protein [Chlamydiales bacterium]